MKPQHCLWAFFVVVLACLFLIRSSDQLRSAGKQFFQQEVKR